MRIAIVHYWLVHMRGGERVLEQICQLFPDADIFTHVVVPERISETIPRHKIQCTYIARLPFAKSQYQKYLGLMPRALEELDLGAYDLVISSESGPAKGVVVRPTATHICYCHSPMRYLWDQFALYREELGPLSRPVFARVAHGLRQWDVTSAARVDRFVANSAFVAERIRRYYHRDADVVHPPVLLDSFVPIDAPPKGYYLMVGEMAGYKRHDLAIEAFRGLDARLVIAGRGPASERIKKIAPPNVSFVGRVTQDELVKLYQECNALIFPGEEDFGLVPVEAMACGRPVIAYASGGALETVIENETGLFFPTQSPEALRAAIAAFENRTSLFEPRLIRLHAEKFSAERFRNSFAKLVSSELEDAWRRRSVMTRRLKTEMALDKALDPPNGAGLGETETVLPAVSPLAAE